MMEITVTVLTFPKRIVCFRSAHPVGALWQRAVHRLPYPRLAGEKVVGCTGLLSLWTGQPLYRHLTRKRESVRAQSRPRH